MKNVNRKPRAPNLDGHLLARVLEVIITLAGKPTWAGIIRAVRHETGVEYTRQALASHPSIAAAYEKRRVGGVGTSVGGRASVAAHRRDEAIRRRDAVEGKLRMELEAVREQLTRWAYNAFVSGGLDETILDKPLPPKDGQGAKVRSKGRSRVWRKRSR